MNVFAASSYGLNPAAVPYVLAGGLAFAIGIGFLLYERFTPASRRFCALSVVMSCWLAAYGASFLAVDDGAREFWYRFGLGLMAVGLPLLFALALELTGRTRPRLMAGMWLVGAAMAVFAAGPLTAGIYQIAYGSILEGWGPLAAAFVGYMGAVIVLVILELWRGLRFAPDPAERRRHFVMLLAIAVGSLGLVDFFIPAGVVMPSGLAPFAIIGSLAIMGLAGARYRAFSISAKFAMDEVMRAMGDAVLVCDPGGIIRIANITARRLLEGGDASLVGSHVGRWLRNADGGEGPIGTDGSGPKHLPIRDREMRLHPSNGEPIEVSVSIEPVSAAEDRRGLVIVARDIRDRVRSERALQAAERRYMALFWHNPGPAYEIDTEGNLLAINPAGERLLGIPAADVRGRFFGELIAPEDVEVASEVFQAVMQGEAREYEIAARTGEGERVELRGVCIPIIDDGDVVGVFGVALDMSETARAKEALEVQRRYFADLFESSPEGIVLVEADTDVVLRVNTEFAHMFGFDPDEVVGRKLNDLIVPEELKDQGLRMNLTARDNGRIRTETVRHRKDGSSVEVSVLARKLVVPGEREQLYGVYRDIGHRKQTERRLRLREEELRHAQKLEAVGKLAGGIAHDFNNLLTVMNGHARLALDSLDPQHPLASDLLEIEKAGARAASLTQQLLAYSRRQVLHPRLVDPNEVVLEVQRMFQRLIGAHIRMETRLAVDDVAVLADRGQLEQVLVNLVVNARDAMASGGTLSLETELLEIPAGDDRVDLWEVAPGPFVRIRVADTGVGMDEATLARAFEPFFTTKAHGEGTGLGLSTVFGIVKQSGGHVMVSSEPDTGTTCDVILPSHSPEPSSTGPETPAPPVSERRGTVLVVEDEAAVRKLVVRVLQQEGCVVLGATNGLDALEVLARHPGGVDLVITDLVMPHMGGRELADRLRESHPGLPVIFMSGYEDALVAEAGSSANFLPKPFTLSALSERVTGALDSAKV